MSLHKKQIKYSLLDLVLISEGISPSETLQLSKTLAQKAENLGYYRFWLAEHHNSIAIASSATTVLMGYIAEATKKYVSVLAELCFLTTPRLLWQNNLERWDYYIQTVSI